MTCPTCGRRVRAELLALAVHDHITPRQFTRLYQKTKEYPNEVLPQVWRDETLDRLPPRPIEEGREGRVLQALRH